MSSKPKPVLGRGLASLIPRVPPVAPRVGRQDDGIASEAVVNIDIDRIQPNPYQPRADFDSIELDELKRSIQEKGIIQPVTVCRVDGGYQLISGERRLRASREAGLVQIPAYIIRIHSREELLELALIENLQRSNLNPIEIAISYKRLTDELDYTIEQVAQKTAKDRSTVTNFLRLLKLPDEIQLSVRKGELSAGHARALIAIDDPVLQRNIYKKIVSKGLSVRQVENAVRERGRAKTAPREAHQRRSGAESAVSNVEEKLQQAFATKVDVKSMNDGKGTITFEYYSPDDLERLLDLFATVHS